MPKPKHNSGIENARQFHAFEVYRDLGYRRSLRETSRQVNACPTTICKWAKLYKWDERLVEHKEVVEQRKAEGALVKIDDPVVQKMLLLLEQTEALIDSVFLPDDAGKISPTIKITSADDLIKLVAEYRKILESYYKFVAEYKPGKREEDRVTKIDKFNVFMGSSSQEERIAMMESMKNGNVLGRNKRIAGNSQDADYTEVPKRGNAD